MRAMLKLIPLILLFCSLTTAQMRIFGRCALSSGAGYENPACGFGAGGTATLSPRIEVDGEGVFLFARKKAATGKQGGHNIAGDLVGRFYLTNHFFVGPAVQVSHQTTFNKTAASIGVVAGVKQGNVTFTARFLQDLTSVNKIRQYDGKIEYFGSRHFYIAGSFGVQDFDCIQGAVGLTKHCVSGRSVFSVGVHF